MVVMQLYQQYLISFTITVKRGYWLKWRHILAMECRINSSHQIEMEAVHVSR